MKESLAKGRGDSVNLGERRCGRKKLEAFIPSSLQFLYTLERGNGGFKEIMKI